MFLDCYDIMIKKIIFKKLKNIILIYLEIKNILNHNLHSNSKQTFNMLQFLGFLASLYFFNNFYIDAIYIQNRSKAWYNSVKPLL
jgi:hypothetical protein